MSESLKLSQTLYLHSIKLDFPNQYRGLLPQLHRVYLDELTIDPNQAIALNDSKRRSLILLRSNALKQGSNHQRQVIAIEKSVDLDVTSH